MYFINNVYSFEMKYYVIAGEASGDLHGSNLIASIKKKDPRAKIRAWGGDLMKAQGATLVKHYRDLAFMGFVEVLMHLRIILNNLKFCKKDILNFAPDANIENPPWYPAAISPVAPTIKKHKAKGYLLLGSPLILRLF